MKASILLTLAFAITVPNLCPASFNPQVLTTQIESTRLSSWIECLDYIETHSSYASSIALSRLSADVASGTITWTVNPVSSKLAPGAFLTGGSVGWPDGEVIEFDTQYELDTAIALIIEATFANQSPESIPTKNSSGPG